MNTVTNVKRKLGVLFLINKKIKVSAFCNNGGLILLSCI